MSSELPGLNEQQRSALRELAELRSFEGPPKEFWPRYLACLAVLSPASKVVMLFQDPAQPTAWKRIAEWHQNISPSRLLTSFQGQLDSLAADCVKNGGDLLALLEPGPPRGAGHYVVASRLKFHRATEVSVATSLLSEVSEPAARESLLRLHLAANVPESYQLHQSIRQAAADVQKLAIAHDLMVAI